MCHARGDSDLPTRFPWCSDPTFFDNCSIYQTTARSQLWQHWPCPYFPWTSSPLDHTFPPPWSPKEQTLFQLSPQASANPFLWASFKFSTFISLLSSISRHHFEDQKCLQLSSCRFCACNGKLTPGARAECRSSRNQFGFWIVSDSSFQALNGGSCARWKILAYQEGRFLGNLSCWEGAEGILEGS